MLAERRTGTALGHTKLAAHSRLAKANYVIGDKGYDANALRRSLRDAGVVPVIPGRINRKRQVRYDTTRYRDRHLIENAFCRLKDFRRIATRYDKLQPSSPSGYERVWTLGADDKAH